MVDGTTLHKGPKTTHNFIGAKDTELYAFHGPQGRLRVPRERHFG